MLLRLLRDTFHVFGGILVVALAFSAFPGCFLVVLLPSRWAAQLDRTRLYDLPAVAKAVEAYRSREGFRPAKLEDLVTAGLLPTLSVDGWNQPFRYERTRTGARVLSLGADGLEGGLGNDADLPCRVEDRSTPRDSCL